MSTPITRQELEITGQIKDTAKKIASLESKLQALKELLESSSSQQSQYQLLGEICVSLQKLTNLGAARLFWDQARDSLPPEQKLALLQMTVAEFQQKITAIQQSQTSLQAEIQNKLKELRQLEIQLAQARQSKDQNKHGYVVARAAHPISYRPVVMPWAKHGADERRFHLILAVFFLLSLALGVLVSVWKLPPPDTDQEVVVPERLAQLIKKKQEKMQEPKPQEKKQDKPTDKEKAAQQASTAATSTAEKKTDTEQARSTAETKGVLALKDSLAELMQESTSAKLGANTRISVSGKPSSGEAPRRSMIVAQSGSGGINSASISRQGSGSGKADNAIPNVKISRVESTIGAIAKANERPQSKELGPSRSDEEIQIVFDRYKSALYRIYNRELRSDPSLRGKMVLRITIETDGHVSACSVKSTDLASPALSSEIVDRVLKFNFGPKPGVPAVTILYPIEFLPAI